MRSVLIIGLILLGACKDNALSIDETSGLNAVGKQEAKWTALGITNYTMTQERLCFCADGQAAIITVRNGAITDAVYASTGQPVPAQSRSAYRTVPELFALVRTTFAKKPATLNVTYDSTLGFPSQVAADISKQTADDEFIVNTGGVVKLNTIRQQ
jgi:hypothetical protein